MANPQAGVYFVQNRGSGTVLDLTGGNSDNNTVIQDFQKRVLTDPLVPIQLWILTLIPGIADNYQIEDARGGTYMTIGANNAVVGNALTGNNNQRWRIRPSVSAPNSFVIDNQQATTYLNLPGGNPDNGTPINVVVNGQGLNTANDNLLWNIVAPA